MTEDQLNRLKDIGRGHKDSGDGTITLPLAEYFELKSKADSVDEVTESLEEAMKLMTNFMKAVCSRSKAKAAES